MNKASDVRFYGGSANSNYVVDYTLSTLEYSMLVLWSMLRRGGAVVLIPIENVTLPILQRMGEFCAKTSQGIKSKLDSVKDKIKYPFRFRFKADTSELEQKLLEIEAIVRSLENNHVTKSDLRAIEARLEYLEKHGIVASQEGGLQLKGKKLSEEKIMFLRAIVRENINLLED